MAETRTNEQDAEAQKKAMDEEISGFENRLGRLRVLYDQYFMGIERLPPEMLRNELDKAFERSKISRSRSTVHKFRFRSVRQKYTSLKSYWDRIVRLIEDGRIRRGLTGRAEISGLAEVPGLEADTAAAETPEDRPSSLREQGQERRRALKEQKRDRERRTLFEPHEVDAIYAALIRHKRAAGDDPGRMTRHALENNIRRILAQAGTPGMRLKVVERDGRVVLVAVRPSGEGPA